MKLKKLLLFASALAVAIALASVATLPVAAQQSKQLRGTYAVTGQASCLVSSLGFNLPPGPLPLTPKSGSTVYSQASTTEGTFKFNADGTGTVEGHEIALLYPPGFASASGNSFSVSFTYEIATDGTMTVGFGEVSGTFVAGPFTGLPFTDNPPQLTGRVGRNGTVVLTSAEPTVEILVIPAFSLMSPRICNRTRVLVPLVDENH